MIVFHCTYVFDQKNKMGKKYICCHCFQTLYICRKRKEKERMHVQKKKKKKKKKNYLHLKTLSIYVFDLFHYARISF